MELEECDFIVVARHGKGGKFLAITQSKQSPQLVLRFEGSKVLDILVSDIYGWELLGLIWYPD